TVSPTTDNLLRAEAAGAVIDRVAPPNGGGRKKLRPATLILPDYAARVTVLDFDSFPAAPEEQLSLVKFRVKKTIPFDVDAAAVAYYPQPASPGRKAEVVAVTIALEIVARYEALFRNLGFHTGEVTTSSLAALGLLRGEDVSVLAKLAGRTLTVVVL